MASTERSVSGLIFDPFAGISGDMILGALVDVGLEPAWIEDFVDSLGLGAQVRVERADRRGIACRRVTFEAEEQERHRHLSDVLEILDERLGGRARDRAAATFRRIAEAEAEVHGTTVERVHFHEVGALDAILDIATAFAGVEVLGIEAFYTRPVGVGRGWVRMAHGRYPLPAPATAKLLEGLPVRETGFEEECTTPTGAAVLATLTGGAAPPAEVVLGRSGFGAGSRDPEDRPNCLRLLRCVVRTGADDALYLVQTDVDDLVPEYVPPAREALERAGAVDVTIGALGMKKGRPGLRIEALVRARDLDEVAGAMLANTSSIGVRHWPVERTVLERCEETIEWRGQRIRMKRVRLPDGRQRSKPEYDDVVRAAQALGLAPYEVRLALERGSSHDGQSDRP